MKSARAEYEEALKIRRELAQKDPETYLPDLGWTLQSLGLLDYSQKRMVQARQEYEVALQARRELAQKTRRLICLM
jgi:tetratricopeptide (TPR) repeat protein